jgi:hypothetical protein
MYEGYSEFKLSVCIPLAFDAKSATGYTKIAALLQNNVR